MSTLDIVAEVLREVAPRALKARQIAALAGDRLPTASRTPETVVSRDLAVDVRDRGTSSRFLRVDRGAFVLKEALPTAFFNDNDAYAAQWTRNLIAAGEIAAGVVDERSIRDLKPADVASYRQCHFFSGLGVWSRALREAGWPEEFPAWTGSAPCQPWSSAGQRKGHADDRDLWPEWFRLIKACRPAVIFGEQVASKDGIRWFDEGPNLQRMQDREAVIGVLQGLCGQGGAEVAVQGVLPAWAKGTEIADERGTRKGTQAVAEAQSRRHSVVHGSFSSKAERSRVFNNPRGHRFETKAGFLRTDWNSLQSKGREVLGQPVSRQDRFIEGIHEGQCSHCAFLRECDGECLGVRQDCGDCECDREAQASDGRGAALWEGFGEELEKEALETSFNSVRSDLEGIGYAVWAVAAPACGVGAPHRRQRLYWVAYARDRGCSFLSSPWLHARRQRGDDAARRGEAHDRISCAVSDAAGTRPRVSQDPGADRGDAREGAEAHDWRSAGDLESERGGAPDEAGPVPDTERVVWNAGRFGSAHGRAAIEPDGHGEIDGAGRNVDGSVGLGDAGLARGGRDAGTFPRAQGAGAGERIEARDFADEPVSPGADDRRVIEHEEMVRGAADVAGDAPGFCPGDRIRIDGDPSWGGAVRGYWAESVEWIYCRPEPGHEDGRWRPAESGTQPLVDGTASDMGRTRAARLRGFGNAIVLPQAASFVEAVIDTFVDAARVLDGVPSASTALDSSRAEDSIVDQGAEDHAA